MKIQTIKYQNITSHGPCWIYMQRYHMTCGQILEWTVTHPVLVNVDNYRDITARRIRDFRKVSRKKIAVHRLWCPTCGVKYR